MGEPLRLPEQGRGQELSRSLIHLGANLSLLQPQDLARLNGFARQELNEGETFQIGTERSQQGPKVVLTLTDKQAGTTDRTDLYEVAAAVQQTGQLEDSQLDSFVILYNSLLEELGQIHSRRATSFDQQHFNAVASSVDALGNLLLASGQEDVVLPNRKEVNRLRIEILGGESTPVREQSGAGEVASLRQQLEEAQGRERDLQEELTQTKERLQRVQRKLDGAGGGGERGETRKRQIQEIVNGPLAQLIADTSRQQIGDIQLALQRLLDEVGVVPIGLRSLATIISHAGLKRMLMDGQIPKAASAEYKIFISKILGQLRAIHPSAPTYLFTALQQIATDNPQEFESVLEIIIEQKS